MDPVKVTLTPGQAAELLLEDIGRLGGSGRRAAPGGHRSARRVRPPSCSWRTSVGSAVPIVGDSLDEKRRRRLDETKAHVAKALTKAGAMLDLDGWVMPR